MNLSQENISYYLIDYPLMKNADDESVFKFYDYLCSRLTQIHLYLKDNPQIKQTPDYKMFRNFFFPDLLGFLSQDKKLLNLFFDYCLTKAISNQSLRGLINEVNKKNKYFTDFDFYITTNEQDDSETIEITPENMEPIQKKVDGLTIEENEDEVELITITIPRIDEFLSSKMDISSNIGLFWLYAEVMFPTILAKEVEDRLSQ